ncbi:MAG TPA: hypothetical protein VGN10_05235 [Pyrinomonadaceae bacterium]
MHDIVFGVKTLAEIEAAVESLPQDKQQELLRFIEARLLNGVPAATQQSTFGRSKRNFPTSKGRIPFTSADVARIEFESDTTR